MTSKELRFSDIENISIEERADENGDKKLIIEGYAAVYDKQTRIGGDSPWAFDEVIERGAFEGANLKDVPLKYNHSDNIPILARTRNKSLTLTPDDNGLFIHAELLDTSDGLDMYKRIKSGLIDKMSFAFTVAVEEVDTTKKIPKRSIKKFDKIFDVSVVDTPAYEDTSVYARSREIAEAWNGAPDGAEQNAKINYHVRSLITAYGNRKGN